METIDKEMSQLTVLLEKGLITSPEMNLRSKIDSLLRSIENLSQKKLRIEYEIKVQKRSLARKRMELKKASKHLKVTLETALKNSTLNEEISPTEDYLFELDNYLFQESFRILDTD